MKSQTNKHGITSFIKNGVEIVKIKGEKNLYGIATVEGQKFVLASTPEEAFKKLGC